LTARPYISNDDPQAQLVQHLSYGFGFFYVVLVTAGFKENRYWFASVVMVKRILIAALIAFIPQNAEKSSVASSLFMALLLFSFLTHLFDPYSNNWENSLDLFGGLVCFGVFAARLSNLLAESDVLIIVLLSMLALGGVVSFFFARSLSQKIRF